jgi:O-acetyl-ADP-ribose deacetylase (regulator of RNase III)
MASPFAGRLELVQGDITLQQVDAIVNAANESLLGGGGVDGAIHRAAGPDLLEECRKLGGCPTGQAKLTRGYNLPARFVLHAVGPVWHGGTSNEDELLASCYRACLDLAGIHGLKSLAFPSISTGAFRFPLGRAARIALAEIRKGLEKFPAIEKVVVVCFDQRTLEAYRQALQDIG